MTGAELIAAERARQVKEEGYDESHDDDHDEGELAMAAVCYAAPEQVYVRGPYGMRGGLSFDDPWPWDYSDDRRALKPRVGKSRIRELVKAGALIAAEIDRLQRAELRAEAKK